MPIDLDQLVTTDALGTKSAAVAIGELVADPFYAPKAWQSHAPAEAFNGHKPPVQDSEEFRRILALERRPQVLKGTERGVGLVRYMNETYGIKRTTPCKCREVSLKHGDHPRDCIDSLNLTQAWALFEIKIVGGLLGPIGVGHGKTILDLLAALAMPNCRTAVLLLPPTLVTQLIGEYELVGQHFCMPSLVVHGKVRLKGDAAPREYIEQNPPGWKPGEVPPTLHVFPYSRLSRHENTVRLYELQPDLIIADEVHKLRNADTATTSRVLNYFKKHSSTRFCGWSGSITDKSIKDYAHLSALALRLGSPLPTNPEVVDDWARALDPGDWPAPPGPLIEFCAPGEHVHVGFHRRLVETKGVVSTTSPAIDCELDIVEKDAPPIPASVQAALDKLRGFWQRPDDEELVDALSVGRCARELACGFYYRWKFPNGEPVALILRWLEFRAKYRKEVRYELARRREHMDSPFLVEQAAKRFHGDLSIPPCPDGVTPEEWEFRHPKWESTYWPDWRDVKPLVKPETEAVRIDDYLAADAAEWARAERGIVWYESNEFGAWVSQLSGLPKHGGGPDAGVLIARETGANSIICSIKSHGTGRDGLQRIFNDQLVAQPPSSATTWEQMLGRLHRIGQPKPCVYARFYRHTIELASHVDQALARALYVQNTLGAEQKLRCGFDLPTPTQAPIEFAAFGVDDGSLYLPGSEDCPFDDDDEE